MAEDIRDIHPDNRLVDPRIVALVAECKRQEESCRYTSASLFIWHKAARSWRSGFLVAPIIVGGLASSQVLTKFGAESGAVVAAILALLAGFFPSIYVALDMDMRHTEIARAGNEFTNLRDRFRQAATIKSHGTYEEFQAEFEALMDRMDAARAASPPTPQWCFEKARKEIQKGRYSFDADERVA
jgi:hypothetical protein